MIRAVWAGLAACLAVCGVAVVAWAEPVAYARFVVDDQSKTGVARGLDPDKLMLDTRLNGETVQREETSGTLNATAAIISHISRHVTLSASDVIFPVPPAAPDPCVPVTWSRST